MSGGTTQQSGTSTSINQIPQWMSDAGQQNYAYAQNVAEQPLQQYQGQMVADVSPQTQQCMGHRRQFGERRRRSIQCRDRGLSRRARADAAATSTAGQISRTPNLDPYMNPFTQDVINATLPGMQQANALSQNQQAQRGELARRIRRLAAGDPARRGAGAGRAEHRPDAGESERRNFTQAQAAATGDINRRLTADTTNQGAAQAKINSDILASSGLTNTGDSMNKANAANYNMLTSAGASQ